MAKFRVAMSSCCRWARWSAFSKVYKNLLLFITLFRLNFKFNQACTIIDTSTMKVILTGCTGMIGAETLRQCILHLSIKSIIVLSRRALTESQLSPKVKVIILSSFTTYESSLFQDLAGASACIWCLGGIPSKFPDLETAKKVNIDYPFEAAKTFIPRLGKKGSKFRFLYISGHPVHRDMEKKHWIFNDAIHIKVNPFVKLWIIGVELTNLWRERLR